VQVPGDDDALTRVLEAVGEHGRWRASCTRGVETPQGIWDVTLTPIESPQTRSVVGIFRDVSEKHALEQLRADFLSMLTHDIKVPLTVILGYTEMLTDPEPPPGQIPPDILTRIRESGETIHALVCNFLDLSRIEAGRMTPTRARSTWARCSPTCSSTTSRRRGEGASPSRWRPRRCLRSSPTSPSWRAWSRTSSATRSSTPPAAGA
jgi:signal transduction histidine kinase